MTVTTDGTDDYWSWSSLREIDTRTGQSKGAAFRVFKQLLTELTEGTDFVVLDPHRSDGIAARWHASDRLYRGSINPVLLAPSTSARVIARLVAVDSR